MDDPAVPAWSDLPSDVDLSREYSPLQINIVALKTER